MSETKKKPEKYHTKLVVFKHSASIPVSEGVTPGGILIMLKGAMPPIFSINLGSHKSCL